MTETRDQIRDAFSAAAPAYDKAAQAQARAARLLGDAIGTLPRTARVLELGCGTGLLTRRLLDMAGALAHVLATDISPAMLEQMRRYLSDRRLDSMLLDAESDHLPAGPFDLVTSSLAAQWFADLPGTIKRLRALLAPGGRLAIATLGADTFKEWNAAHAQMGVRSGVPHYPTSHQLEAMAPGAKVASHHFQMSYPSAQAFLGTLVQVGARTARAGHKPLDPGTMRRILKTMGSPCQLTWEVLVLIIEAAP
jgi:malonyl-CoA O-methyltransferase